MDKNFIKIDDLVRQRLTGVEEKEKSGAWMNMRDLLDKEMPQQKRISIFYWRRIFSAVAVLSLLGSVCIGGMELSSFYKNANNETTPLAAAPTAAGNDNAAMLVSDGNTNATLTGVGTSNSAGHTSVDNAIKSTSTASMQPDANGSRSATSTDNNGMGDNNAIVNSPVTAADAKVSTSHRKTATHATQIAKREASTNSSQTNSSTLVTAANSGNNNTGEIKDNSNKIAHRNLKNNTNNTENATNSNTVTKTVANNTTSNTNGNSSRHIAGTNKSTSLQPNKTTNIAATTNQANTVASEDATGNNNTIGTTTNSNPIAAAETKKATLATAQKEAKLEVLNSSAPTVATPANIGAKETAVPELRNNNTDDKIANATVNEKANTDKARNTNAVPAGTTAATTAKIANSPAKAALRNAKANKEKAEKLIDNTIGSSTIATTGGVAPKPKADDNSNKPKRVITKIQVHQRTIMLSANVYGNRIDTISIEKVNVDLGFRPSRSNSEEESLIAKAKNNNAVENTEAENKQVGKNHKTGRHAATPGTISNGNQKTLAPAAKAGKGTYNNNSNTDPSSLSANQSEQNNSSEDDKYEEILPGAATTSNENTPESVAKENEAVASTPTATKPTEQEHKGMSMIKKLSAAFNDVKESAARAHLVGGLTAGINSNFFGSNSFKGFHFGMTANLIFNDTWNIMTEMKYFHRLNNNQSIEDNYYSYTPAFGNQYSKQLLLNSYSFSALHSIEMPVAIRYAKGKFNFYSGGNFLYSFSINTGAETLPTYNVAPVLVNEVGPDNTPKLKEEDFRSRFGIGYLFGFSYKLAPNASLDFRTVQTVWDNSNGTGAKSVSGQLYRAPSLQLSIMYRLGGNRHED